MKMLPPQRPNLMRDEALARLAVFKIDFARHPMVVFGIRGYYLNSMGRTGMNDRAIYDDAIGIITPNEYGVFNGNTDPTAPPNAVTGRASLEPGLWPMWRLDLHKGQYRAFCQRLAPCVVRRDNTEGFRAGTTHQKYGRCLGEGRWSGYFGINCHRGGPSTTSSEGCQTVPEPQWSELIKLAEKEARRLWKDQWDQKCIPYALIG